jgi:hypothetical protein
MTGLDRGTAGVDGVEGAELSLSIRTSSRESCGNISERMHHGLLIGRTKLRIDTEAFLRLGRSCYDRIEGTAAVLEAFC